MKLNLLVLLIFAFVAKQLFWLAVIPLWHFPDEEQHFGQTAFWAEVGRLPHGSEKDINREIDSASAILGTKRDTRGINQFTYHPDFRIPYTKTEDGLHEQEIKALNSPENRQTMVKQEAARYGPIYYILTGLGYRLFFQQDLLVRVFSSRFISFGLSLINILLVYFIAKKIFQNKLESLVLVFLVAFQPMFSFVSAGVNSDNLFNLVFNLILYSLIQLSFPDKKPSAINKIFYFLLLIFSMLIGFYTKKQIYIAWPVILLALLMWLKEKKFKFKKYLPLFFLLAAALIFSNYQKIYIPEYNRQAPSLLKENFGQYFYWHLRHTIAETIPWYWGVFNWLGVALPRWIYQVQARILILSALGILIFYFKQITKRIASSQPIKSINFLLGAAIIYYVSIISWDYLYRTTAGFSFGIQGRYFFPTIVPHMILIIVGLKTLIPQKFVLPMLKILAGWWSVYGLIGLKTAVQSYYTLWPVSSFLNQASQYKPEIFKGGILLVLLAVFIILTVAFLYRLLNYAENKN